MANDIIVTIQEKMKLDDNIIGLYLIIINKYRI